MAAKSGMLSAEAAFEAVVAGDSSAAKLGRYEQLVESSWIKTELYPERNFHQGFKRGLVFGLMNAGAMMATGGRGFGVYDKLEAEPDHERMYTVAEMKSRDPLADSRALDVKLDGKYGLDRLTDLYFSGTQHEEDQPAHLLVPNRDLCATRCYEEFRNPCTRFCPAFVYEIETNETTGRRALKLNPSNCVHCKTCDIKDPYENIDWVPPEGSGGPRYSGL
jgi:electron-transferring-flavoprotein dehydrogenase